MMATRIALLLLVCACGGDDDPTVDVAGDSVAADATVPDAFEAPPLPPVEEWPCGATYECCMGVCLPLCAPTLPPEDNGSTCETACAARCGGGLW